MTRSASIPSGFSSLDQALPTAGWPIGALTEIIAPRVGDGELRLLVPILRKLTQAGRTVALLVPPYLAYVPVLIQHGISLEHVKVIRSTLALDGLWAIEDALKNAEFGALIAILPPAQPESESRGAVRRLQMAARLSQCPAFLFHTSSTPDATQSAQLRLLIDSSVPGVMQVQIIDEHAPGAHRSLSLDLPLPARRPLLDRKAMPLLAMQSQAPLSTASSSVPDAASSFLPTLGDSKTIPALTPASPMKTPERRPWPFRQRRKTPETPSIYPLALAFLFSRNG